MKKRIARNCDDSKYTVPDDTTHSIDIGSIFSIGREKSGWHALTGPKECASGSKLSQRQTQIGGWYSMIFSGPKHGGFCTGPGPRIIRIYQVSLHPTWSNGHPKGMSDVRALHLVGLPPPPTVHRTYKKQQNSASHCDTQPCYTAIPLKRWTYCTSNHCRWSCLSQSNVIKMVS